MPSFIHPSDNFERPSRPTPANGAPLSVRMRSGTPHNLLKYIQVTIMREADHAKSRDWAAAHRTDVAESVRRCDLAEGKRIVYKRSKEVYGLHESKVRSQPIHTRVVRHIKTHQEVRIHLPGQLSQHCGQRTWSELAGASSGLDLLRQPYHRRSAQSMYPLALEKASYRSLARLCNAKEVLSFR